MALQVPKLLFADAWFYIGTNDSMGKPRSHRRGRLSSPLKGGYHHVHSSDCCRMLRLGGSFSTTLLSLCVGLQVHLVEDLFHSFPRLMSLFHSLFSQFHQIVWFGSVESVIRISFTLTVSDQYD